MTASKIFLYFCLSFIGGIFLNSFFNISQILMLSFLILGLILISLFWQYKKIVVIGFSILFLVLGIWRHQNFEMKSLNSELRKFNDKEELITLIGIVSEEPEVRGKNLKLTIKTEQLVMGNQEWVISGKVLVTASRYPQYQYGDKLKIIGKFKTPQVFEGFNYKDWLKKEGIYSVIYFPKIELLGKNYGHPLKRILFSFKNKFQEISQEFFSPPQQGILEALVFGQEENISPAWKEKLNLTGTRHITAVSGMNVTIITFLIFNFLLFLGFWRQHSFYLSIILIILYILMIGAPSSAVRAGIMGILLILTQYFGRFSQTHRAVIFAAALMLFFNPFLLKLDIGFQLSFLAVLGLIYLQPVFFDYFKKTPDHKFLPIRTTLSTTLAAQIFTLPILIYNFGKISLISPITNLLIVPILAPLTILIFIFGISGMIFWFFSQVLFFPTWFFLTYIVKIIDFFSHLPFTSLTLEKIHWFWLLIFYLILGYFVWRLQENQKLKFLKF